MNHIARFVEDKQGERERELERPLTRAEQLRFRLRWGLIISSPLIFIVVVGTIRAIANHLP